MIKAEGTKITLGYSKEHTEHSDMITEFAVDLGLILFVLSESVSDEDFDFILNESRNVFAKASEGEEL